MIIISINNSMTPKFDEWYRQILTEYTTAKNKRRESRYWSPSSYSSLKNVRRVSNKNNMSDSQASKLGNHQYVGNAMGPDGPRQNTSEKSIDSAGIAKGLGGYVAPTDGNPKKVGASINSKQGDMIVKYRLANGTAKVGSRGKKIYGDGMVKLDHLKRYKKLFK